MQKIKYLCVVFATIYHYDYKKKVVKKIFRKTQVLVKYE